MSRTALKQRSRVASSGVDPNERAALGKTARAEVPRTSHGVWEPDSSRPDPLEVLQAQDADRVAALVPLRHGRMLASPFTFYRGAAAIMAADLALTPTSGFWVQACGDAHLSNFGAFASPDRNLVLDVNDFDESLPGPWEWDLKRLAASFEIAGRDRGFTKRQRRDVVLAAARTYREHMRNLSALSNLDVWYARVDVAQIREAFVPSVNKKERKTFERSVAKSLRKDRLRAFAKLTTRVDGELRIKSDPPVIVRFDEVFAGRQLKTAQARLQEVLEVYRGTLNPASRHLYDQYRFVDAAHKVVGVGSVGARAWIVLLIGRDDEDPLFLQVKEANSSVLEPYTAESEFAHNGQRVVEGQRVTQASSDILLGWLSAVGPDSVQRDFYVRQLWDQKGSAAVELMTPRMMDIYAQICGRILARAHARSGDRIAIGSYLGGGDSFDRAMGRFAAAYADQNERDYGLLQAAAADGRLAVELDAA